jgi:hypothetical protein
MPIRRSPVAWWGLIVTVFALIAGAFFLKWHQTQERPAISTATAVRPQLTFQFQKGMTYATWNADALGRAASDASLHQLADTNTEWVAFVPTWYQAHYNSTEIGPAAKTPTDESLIHAIQQAHDLGLKVMLKPHVDLSDDAGISWRGEIEFPNAEGWEAWFQSYESFILHYAQLARDQGVDLLCVGTELTSSVWHEASWRAVVAKVRSVYEGPLTYAANWNEEYQLVKFWDALDYAGLDPYFPLSEQDRPMLEEIKAGWQPHLAEIERWQQQIRKPVIFTELGYKSIQGAARRPWEDAIGPADVELQRDCYQAALETFWDRPWFSGVYWWHWGTHEKMGGPEHQGFTPQNKPAQAVVTEWFRKPPGARRN